MTRSVTEPHSHTATQLQREAASGRPHTHLLTKGCLGVATKHISGLVCVCGRLCAFVFVCMCGDLCYLRVSKFVNGCSLLVAAGWLLIVVLFNLMCVLLQNVFWVHCVFVSGFASWSVTGKLRRDHACLFCAVAPVHQVVSKISVFCTHRFSFWPHVAADLDSGFRNAATRPWTCVRRPLLSKSFKTYWCL